MTQDEKSSYPQGQIVSPMIQAKTEELRENVLPRVALSDSNKDSKSA